MSQGIICDFGPGKFHELNMLEECKEVVKGANPSEHLHLFGYPKTTVQDDKEKLLSLIPSSFKLRGILRSSFDSEKHFYISEEISGYIYIFFDYKDQDITINSQSTEGKLSEFFNALRENMVFARPPEPGCVHILSSTPTGYSVQRIDKINYPLISDNYNKNVVSAYNHVTSCLKSKDPCGRFVLLHGEPGTGKTFLIRSLISEIEEVTTIIIPGSIVGQLTGPGLLPTLIGEKENKKPIMLVVEDADSIIANRNENKDKSVLSDILNLTDGILGSAIDVRIIATTNANFLNVDNAVKRVGRLCTEIYVGPLTPPEANQVYNRLTGESKIMKNDTILSEIYQDAKKYKSHNVTKNIEVPGTYL
jgi:hypothetical protein